MTPRARLLAPALILPALLTGCASTAEQAPAPTVTVTAAASLPPGAEDVWDLGLSGNLIDDLGQEMDLEQLTGAGGVFTASQWVANQMTDVCMADTDRLHPALESDLERSVRMIVGNDEIADEQRFVRVLASYGCPDEQELVDTALSRAS